MTDNTTNAPTTTFEDLKDTFGLFDDWEDRYRYLIDLGRELPEFPEELRSDHSRVPGCMSQVWLANRLEEGPPKKIHFWIDSDAHLVRGLAAVMHILYSGKTPEEILALDADVCLDQLGLRDHISPNRRNGLASMIETIKAAARRAVENG